MLSRSTLSRTLGALTALSALAHAVPAHAGIGCDFNIRVNNKTPRAITVYGEAESSASKAGLGLWNPIDGMRDAALTPEGSGASSHSKQAVELALPCNTGKVDFKIKYLDGSTPLWKYRYGVSIKAGDTIQINIP